MTPRRARDKEQTIEDILIAARNLFSEKGLHGTSIRDIENASGVSKGLILYHFENKEKLYGAVKEQLVKEYTSELLRSRQESKNLPDSIQSAVQASFQHTRTGRDFQRISLWSYLEGQEESSEIEEKFTQGLIEMMRSGQEAGLLRDDIDPFVMPFIIKGTIEYWIRKEQLIRALDQDVDFETCQQNLLDALSKLFLK